MPHDPSVVFIRCPSSVLRDRARSCSSHLATLTKVPAGLWIVRSYLAVIPYLRGRGMQWITIDPCFHAHDRILNCFVPPPLVHIHGCSATFRDPPTQASNPMEGCMKSGIASEIPMISCLGTGNVVQPSMGTGITG